MEPMNDQSINLGHHVASMDETTGEVSISGKDTTTRLATDEVSRLLAWLQNEHRDRRYEKFHDPLRDSSEKEFDAS